MASLVELFVHVDDFCKEYMPKLNQVLLENGVIQRQRQRSLTMSEIMTILIHFHQSHYRNFKAYYCEHVLMHLRSEFPGLVSYTRFVEFMPSAILPLCAYLRLACFGNCTGISFIDATSLDVCLNQRISSHKVFAGLAQRGKTSTGWFFGFKLHVVFNDRGELLNATVTAGNVDDRKPVPQLAQKLFGKLIGDKGYLSQPLFEQLYTTLGVQLITKIKSNMKNRLMPFADKLLLRKRAIVETIIDQLKNISQIEHSRHRSITGFMANVLCGLIAYTHQPVKPSIGRDNLLALTA